MWDQPIEQVFACVFVRADKRSNPLTWYPTPCLMCQPAHRSAAPVQMMFGRSARALLHIGAGINAATAPLLLCSPTLAGAVFDNGKWNAWTRPDAAVRLMVLAASISCAVPCKGGTTSYRRADCVVVGAGSTSHRLLLFSCCPPSASHSRWSTPHLEARPKGFTSTTWLWVWYCWPEDAMKKRPSVSCLYMSLKTHWFPTCCIEVGHVFDLWGHSGF